jgi:LPS O-antigen subunit length determinant protein (WzzB/FepE family)
MVKNSQISYEEFDFIEFMKTVWKGKWKIAVAVVISFIAATSYQSTQTKNFTAKTEIRPIDTLTLNEYIFFNNTSEIIQNNFKFKKITKSNLLDLYIETLNDKSVFEDAMLKLNFLDASQYSDENKYNEAVIRIASSIKILKPLINKEEEDNLGIFYHSINFIHDDVKEWKNILLYVDEMTNKIVKKKILQNYNNTLSFLKKNQQYQLENIKMLKANAQSNFYTEMKKFEMNLEFQLEDAQTKIDNALVDYDRETADRLLFLREQASIARKLEIAKNTIEAQTFSTQNGMVANIKIDNPFYLRGYEAIEKEIELIQLRDDKRAFIGGLLKLEQKKRNLEQDRTLLRIEKNKVFLDSLIVLEEKKRVIEQDNNIQRFELAFQSTPLSNKNKLSSRLVNKNKFFAASIKVPTTEFQYKDSKILVRAIVIGLIVGVFYVIISNAFQTHRVSRKKTN